MTLRTAMLPAAAIVAGVILFGSGAAARGAEPSELRTWRDSTGAFSVSARLVQVTATRITLRTSDGRVVQVPMDRLSAADRQFIADLAASPQPAAAEAENTSPTAAGQPAASSPAPPAVTPPGPQLTAADRQAPTAAERAPLPAEGVTKAPSVPDPPSGVAPDPAADWKPWPKGGFGVAAADAYDQVGRPVLIDRASGLVALSIGRHMAGQPQSARGRLYSGRLPQGPAELLLDVPVCIALLDFEPVSGRALMMSDLDHFQRGGELVLLDGLAAGKPKELFRRQLPGIDKPGFKPQVKWARLLSGEHAAVVLDSEFYLWNLRTAQLLYRIGNIASSPLPALSANRRYAAFPSGGGAGVIDLLDGRSLGFVTLGGSLSPAAAFHPDGRRLALAASNQLLVWDLVEGRATCETTLAAHLGSNLTGWVEPHAVLTDLGRLVRTDLEMTVWSYSLPSVAGAEPTSQGVISSQRVSSSCTVASLAVPHAAAEKAAQQLERGGQSMLLLRPGSKVALDAEVIPGVDREPILAALREAVEGAGWQVVPKADTVVVAHIAQGKPQQLSYRKMTPGQPRESATVETATIKPFTAELQIRRGGQVLWTRETRNHVPSMLFMKNGETLQDAVKAFERPDAGFFARLTIPPSIPKPEAANGLGFSSADNFRWKDMPPLPVVPRKR